MIGLALPLVKPALGALARAGLRFGAEKVLKKVFGKGFVVKEIIFYRLVETMTPDQKKVMERHHVGEGVVSGGSAKYGGLHGRLASIGILFAISLVEKVLGKGLKVRPRSSRSFPRPPPPSLGSFAAGRGMQGGSPPFFSTWNDYGKKKDRKMVRALDAVPLKQRHWENAAARNAINVKQKLGLGM